MSYDLIIKTRKGKFLKKEFVKYFKGRENYYVNISQAHYQNDATGVTFSFELCPPEEGKKGYSVAFNMNYFRPSFFVLEAEPEVSGFIEEFDMAVDDPQLNGMGDGDYDKGKFYDGWLSGNAFGCQAILRMDQDIDVLSLSTETLKDVWSWNFAKEERQNAVEDNVFIPRIMLIKHQGKVATMAVWPDAIPSLLPKVDFLLIGRAELSPENGPESGDTSVLGEWSIFEPLIEENTTKMLHGGYCLNYETVPENIENLVKSLESLNGGMEGLQRLEMDQVLDQGFVERNEA